MCNECQYVKGQKIFHHRNQRIYLCHCSIYLHFCVFLFVYFSLYLNHLEFEGVIFKTEICFFGHKGIFIWSHKKTCLYVLKMTRSFRFQKLYDNHYQKNDLYSSNFVYSKYFRCSLIVIIVY